MIYETSIVRCKHMISMLTVIILILLYAQSTQAQTTIPIHLAGQKGDIATVKKLIASGEDVNKQDREGWTALMFASVMGQTSAVETLLNAGANPNVQSNDGATPLMAAARIGNVKVVRLLLVKGAVNIRNRADLSALDLAMSSGHTSVVNLINASQGILEANMKVLEEDQKKNIELKKITELKRIAEQKKKALEMGEALIDAVYDPPRFNALIAAGANVNIRNNKGDTALMNAVSSNQIEIVKTLIAAGANVNIKNKTYSKTPLLWAATYGNLEVVKALIAAGADVNVRGKDGDSAVTNAASSNHIEIVKVLIAAKADLNIVGKSDMTALMFAIMDGSIDVVKALVAAGADVNYRSGTGTALRMAKRRAKSDGNSTNRDIVQILEHAGAIDARGY